MITASGPGGTAVDTVTVSVHQKPTVNISAFPNPVAAGETAILTWSSTDADTAFINHGIGPVGVNGSAEVDLQETTAYTITVTGPGGTATDSVIVVVNERQGENFGYAFIPNTWENDVSVIDLETNTVVQRIKVGLEPYGVEVSPDSERVYVTCDQGGIYVIDIVSKTVVGTIDVTASCVAVSPDSSTVYAVCPYDNAVSVIDASSYAIIDIIDVGATPHGIAMSPDGSTLYVTNIEDSSVSVIDVSSGSVIETVWLAPSCAPLDAEMMPDGSCVYVVCSFDHTVRVIDSITNVVVSEIPIIILDGYTYPRYVAFSPDGLYAYVSDASGYLLVVDTSIAGIVGHVRLDEGITDVDVTPDGRYLYVPNTQTSCVTVVDAALRSAVLSIDEDLSCPFTCGHFIVLNKFKVSGRVISSSGSTGIEGVKLALGNGNIMTTAITDREGRYTLAAPSGTHTVTISKPGHIFSRDSMTVVVNNGNIEVPDIEVILGVDIIADQDTIISGESAVLAWNSIVLDAEAYGSGSPCAHTAHQRPWEATRSAPCTPLPSADPTSRDSTCGRAQRPRPRRRPSTTRASISSLCSPGLAPRASARHSPTPPVSPDSRSSAALSRTRAGAPPEASPVRRIACPRRVCPNDISVWSAVSAVIHAASSRSRARYDSATIKPRSPLAPTVSTPPASLTARVIVAFPRFARRSQA